LGNALVLRCFTFGQDVRGPVVELTSVFRKREASRRAVEKASAEFLLDSPDGLRDSASQQSEFGCRSHKRARLKHLGEYRQTFKIVKLRHSPRRPLRLTQALQIHLHMLS
jgi:hypothetical protein